MSVDHHTDRYSWNTSVYRRGFPISFSCYCENSSKISSMWVILNTGRVSGSYSSKEFRVNHGYENMGWSMAYETTSKPNVITINLYSPPTAIIGQYFANVYINGKLRVSKRFLLFFNPWCQGDVVYMDDPKQRYEFIENTHTIIYMGTASHIVPREWYLAQFQSYSVEAALMLLDKMKVDDRSSPVTVSRFLSALVNANDDNGVVNGNWSGSYKGGVHPNAWNGSGLILAKYAKYRAPVRFGQCWVFAGVLCSVLRTCGIPARCITNYNSFHDLDGSLAWEVYFNRFLRQVNFRRQETMWNFHCWNEAWMDRKDLPVGYGGWQIVDSTPQERSFGTFRCGPASKAAVKEGNVSLLYDTGFVFAEVNADKIFYFQRPRGGFTIGRIDSFVVGRAISSKSVGSNSRMDLTSTYKHPDDSPAERMIQKKIQQRNKNYRSIQQSAVKIEINPPSSVSYRSDCTIAFKIINNSNTNCSVKFRVAIQSVTYRGRVNQTLLEQTYATPINGQSSKNFQEVIRSEQLRNAIESDFSMIKVDINGLVNEQSFIHSEATISIDHPRIEIGGIPNLMHPGETYQIQISVFNPFQKDLTGTKLLVSGEVLLNGRMKINAGTIPSMKVFQAQIDIFSRREGEFYIYASLSSNEASGFNQALPLVFS